MNESRLDIIFDMIKNTYTITSLEKLSDEIANVVNCYEIIEKNGFDNVAKLLRKSYNIIERMTWGDFIDSELLRDAKQYLSGASYLLAKKDSENSYKEWQTNLIKGAFNPNNLQKISLT